MPQIPPASCSNASYACGSIKQEFGRRRRDIEQEVAHGADHVLAHQRRGVHVGVVLEVGDVFWHFLFAKKEL